MSEPSRSLLSRAWSAVTRRAPRGPLGLEVDPRVVNGSPIGESGVVRKGYFTTVENEPPSSKFGSLSTWIATAREMLSTDPVLSGCWRYIAQRQMSALGKAYWLPSEWSTEGRRNAAFLNENFGLGAYKGRGRLKEGLLKQFGPVLMWQPFGVVVLEEITHVAPDRGGVNRIWLSKWAPRSLTRLEAWDLDADERVVGARMHRFDGGQYYLPFTGEHPDFPGKGCLYIAADTEGGDPEGRMGAMLRPPYGYWRLDRLAMDQLGVGLERWGSELPMGVVKYELLEKITDRRMRDEALASMRNLLRDMAAREESYAFCSDAAEVKPFGARFDPTPITALSETLDRKKAICMFMQAALLGATDTGTGSYNSATVHADGGLQIFANLAEITAEAISVQTGDRLLQLNFGAGTPGCTLVLPGVRRNTLPDMAAHIAQAIANGSMTPTDDVESAFREAAGLEPLEFSRPWQERLGDAAQTPPGSPGPGRPEGAQGEADRPAVRGRKVLDGRKILDRKQILGFVNLMLGQMHGQPPATEAEVFTA